MDGTHRTTKQKSDLGGVHKANGLTHVARIMGRLLLWGCVLLLLIRGALSILSTPSSHVVTTTRGVTVTVTQPAHTETSQARRK
jgi:hypothetical protein